LSRSIAEAIVIKNDNLFFLTTKTGEVPTRGGHGLGLYYHDCRYLNGYALRLADTDPTVLVNNAAAGDRAVLELTNVDLHAGDQVIPKETIALTWERVLDGERLRLSDQLTVNNLGLEPVAFPITIAFDAAFEDVFTVRALLNEQPGHVSPAEWHGNALVFRYAGADGLERTLHIECSRPPDHGSGTTARWNVQLDGRTSQTLQVDLTVTEGEQAASAIPAARDHPPETAPDWQRRWTDVTSASLLLNRLFERSAIDLEMLRSSIGHETYFAAGLPWFGALFGRDSLITALETLAYNPHIAEQTLRLLAGRQGTTVDRWRDEQPGKILHELRVGELAHLGQIPHTPYYGTIDATPLFLILLAEHAEWTGSLALYHELHDPVERALRWMDEYGDSDADGYLDYHGQSAMGLINQGWKDSIDGIVNADGSRVSPPVAVVEVQGYAYRARMGIAGLAERAGETDRAGQLRAAAGALRERFNRDFWSDQLGCYLLALQADHQPAAVVASNPGQALWTGIADDDQAGRTVDRLMADDMFNGWGIRTLSSQARRYNPIGYHLGTVWPHDNALIAAGFRRYGHDTAAMQIMTAMFEASTYFDAYRLPELFAGFERSRFGVPVSYPVACHPQAWSAGAAPYLLQVCLGLQAQAFDHKLVITRPLLPPFVDWIELTGLRIGEAVVKLRFTRKSEVNAAVEVVSVHGDNLDVVLVP
jgi:glycogen debranching enzyme